MTERHKKQLIIKELRQQWLSKFGPACEEAIDTEIVSLSTKRQLDQREIQMAAARIQKRLAGH